MAKHFFNHGWNDITIAFPFNIREAEDAALLADKCTINLLVDSEYTARWLCKNFKAEAGVFIKVDTGYKRTGIPYYDHQQIEQLASVLASSENLCFKGLLTHSGQTYLASGKKMVQKIHQESLLRINGVREALSGYKDIIISIGDTPSCSICNDFNNCGEIRPGNFVFYDLMQENIGSCGKEDIAIVIACPVITEYPLRKNISVYGGAVHLSKESLRLKNSASVFGQIVLFNGKKWIFTEEKNYLARISQEHGIIEAGPYLRKIVKAGDIIGIIPVHSCLTANLFDRFYTLDGKIIKK
jgi:D-serine deaminase-like pyridoxal phosphate-dependent protein